MLDKVLFENISNQCRVKTIEIANRVGGVHIGGIFSILDFLVLYYSEGSSLALNSLKFYEGCFSKKQPILIFSKGHCYLSQLIVLDEIFSKNYYSINYLKQGEKFFGHPKRSLRNQHFPISSGSLGQGIVFANGVAFAKKLSGLEGRILVILGDGELNEGSCTEAMLFAVQHKLPITYILDNNKQMSLDKVDKIFSNGELPLRFLSYGLNVRSLDGHNYHDLSSAINDIYKSQNYDSSPEMIILNTIKGYGISFMEGDAKWHHRRFKNSEYNLAIEELSKKNHAK
jgi:transketolase